MGTILSKHLTMLIIIIITAPERFVEEEKKDAKRPYLKNQKEVMVQNSRREMKALKHQYNL